VAVININDDDDDFMTIGGAHGDDSIQRPGALPAINFQCLPESAQLPNGNYKLQNFEEIFRKKLNNFGWK